MVSDWKMTLAKFSLATTAVLVLFGTYIRTDAFTDEAKWSIPWDEVDDRITDIIDEKWYEGATIGIMQGGKLVYTQGYGTIDGSTAHPTALLPIGSISKTITAVAILKLMQDGLLNLDSKVFGPGGLMRMVALEPKSYDPRLLDITVEHLLRHTAGWDESQGPIYDPMLNPIYINQGWEVVDISRKMKVDGILNQHDILRFMVTQPLDFSPGSKVVHSNFGYSVLGRIVEEVTDLPYEDYVREMIFKTLGMWRTRVGPNENTKDRISKVLDFTATLYQAVHFEEKEKGYRHKAGEPILGNEGVVNPEVLDSTLGWFSNVFELSRFYTNLEELLTPSTLRYMLRRPASPEPLLDDVWDGVGFRVRQDGTFWSQNDHHGNDAILYHHGIFNAPRHPKNLASDDDDLRSTGLTVVLLMTGNKWVNLERKVERLLNRLNNWPIVEDAFVYDLADSRIYREDLDMLVHYTLSEHNLQAYMNALRLAGYIPKWIHGYQNGHHSSFIVISQRVEFYDELEYVVRHSGQDSTLIQQIQELGEQGYFVQLLQTYHSSAYDGQMGHVAMLIPDNEPSYKVGVAEPLDSYFRELDKGTRHHYQPFVQSIGSTDDQIFTSYLLVKTEDAQKNTRSYHDLEIQDLETAVQNNVQDGFHLDYLDTWDDYGVPVFSAIFRKTESKLQWVLSDDIRPDTLIAEGKKWEMLGYLPKFMVAYTEEKILKFAGFWIKPV